MTRQKSTHVDHPVAAGRRLKEARERAGLSQRRLAFPGCSAAYISRIESGDRIASLQVLRELARRLDVSEDYDVLIRASQLCGVLDTGVATSLYRRWQRPTGTTSEITYDMWDRTHKAVLAKLDALPVRTWSYRSEEDSVRHMGPTAQEFRAAGLKAEAVSGRTPPARLARDGVTPQEARHAGRAGRCGGRRPGWCGGRRHPRPPRYRDAAR